MDKKRTGVIYGVNGPVIYLQGKSDFKMSEMVYVGEQRLVGEVIGTGQRTYDPFRCMMKLQTSSEKS